MSIKVLLADDHEIILDGLYALIEKEPGMEVVGQAKDGQMAVRLAHELSPDIVIMDINMPNLNGVEATGRIIASVPGVKVIALSVHSDRRFVVRMLKAGAKGYLIKNAAFKELVLAIRAVSKNEIYLSPNIAGNVVKNYINQLPTDSVLTPREREVLQLVAEGKTTRQIAELLFISVKTVERHRSQILDKLNIHSLADLIKYAVREGFTTLEP